MPLSKDGYFKIYRIYLIIIIEARLNLVQKQSRSFNTASIYLELCFNLSYFKFGLLLSQNISEFWRAKIGKVCLSANTLPNILSERARAL